MGVASLYRYFPRSRGHRRGGDPQRNPVRIWIALSLHQQLALLKGDPEAWSHFRRLALAERLRFLIDGVVRASRLLVERFGLEFLTRYRDSAASRAGHSARR